MKQTRILLVFLLLILFAAPAHAVRLKIATLSPDGSSWMKKMRQGAREIEEKTQGRVKLKFYPGGIMGNDEAVLRKIRFGQLQGGALTAGSLARFYPDNQILCLPLLFRSQEEIDHVRKQLDPMIMEGMEKGGFTCFGLAGGGFAYIMSQSQVRTVEDLKKRKVWTPPNDPISEQTLEAFGVKSIPLPLPDVLAGLQTGLVDTVTISPVGALALSWHTQVKQLTATPVMYLYGTFVISNKAFKKLKPEDRKVMREVMGRVFAQIDRDNAASDREAFQALLNQGIEKVVPLPEVEETWFAKGPEIAEILVKNGKISQEALDKLNKILAQYRQTRSQ